SQSSGSLDARNVAGVPARRRSARHRFTRPLGAHRPRRRAMISLPITDAARDCWNSIGVRGDRSCPELMEFVHCQNCPVFAAAGRRFLDAPSPDGYLDEWTDRLAEHADELSCDLLSVLVFRLADEWLALPIQTLVEVTPPRPVHRVPYRTGLLAGLVNIRGE